MSAQPGPIEQWDRYWAFGNLHSFSQVHEGNYRGAIAAFWREQLAALPDGARVLDIATGNGAVALFALDESDARATPFGIDATDLAGIDPASRVSEPALRERLARLRFHPRTPAESLPFADGAFDIACSQYGIEYSRLEASLPEVARVLAPGGRLAAILHHAESVFLASVPDEIAGMDFVLDEVRLYLKTRNLLRAMAEAGRGRRSSPKVVRKRRAVDEALQRIDAAARDAAQPRMLQGPAQYVREILGMLESRSPAELERWLEEARQRVRANRQRVTDMQAAARAVADPDALAERLRGAGLEPGRLERLAQEDGSLLGWRLEARRPA